MSTTGGLCVQVSAGQTQQLVIHINSTVWSLLPTGIFIDQRWMQTHPDNDPCDNVLKPPDLEHVSVCRTSNNMPGSHYYGYSFVVLRRLLFKLAEMLLGDIQLGQVKFYAVDKQSNCPRMEDLRRS